MAADGSSLTDRPIHLTTSTARELARLLVYAADSETAEDGPAYENCLTSEEQHAIDEDAMDALEELRSEGEL